MNWLEQIAEIVAREGVAARVVIIGTAGPTPRAAGAFMLVGQSSSAGKIGRGEVETRSVEVGRDMMRRVQAVQPHRPPLWMRERLRFSTGDVLGDRSGGSLDVLVEAFGPVEIAALARLRAAAGEPTTMLRSVASGLEPQLLATDFALAATPVREANEILAAAPLRTLIVLRSEDGGEVIVERLAPDVPPFHVYGTGLVARALAKLLADLPFRTIWLDTAPGHFPPVIPGGVETRACTDLSAAASSSAAGGFHAVMTASHELDLAVARALVTGGKARFVGVVGSALKRERLLGQLRKDGVGEVALAQLVCPIGLPQIRSKIPEVIAIGIAAQVLALLQPNNVLGDHIYAELRAGSKA